MATEVTAADTSPWVVASSRRRIDDSWFRVRQDDLVLPSGHEINGYFVWESPDIATVVPVTPGGRFVLCRQYRHAVGRVMLQFPAGGIGDGESAEDAARRELEEETGYTAGSLEPLGRTAAYPTKLSGWHHLFLARDVVAGGCKADDPHEPTQVLTVTAAEIHQLLDSGQVQVGDSVSAALLALRRLGG